LDEKREKGSMPDDVAYYLIEDLKTSGDAEKSWKWLSGDALLAIVAGRWAFLG
jgi:hypothetical protein